MFDAFVELIRRNPKNYHHELRRGGKYAGLKCWIDSCLRLLEDPFYGISTKCHWILNGLTDFPACENCGKPLSRLNVSIYRGYPRFCSAKCACGCRATVEKIKSSKLERHGSTDWNNTEKSRRTRIERYGGWEKPDTKARREATCVERYGHKTNL